MHISYADFGIFKCSWYKKKDSLNFLGISFLHCCENPTSLTLVSVDRCILAFDALPGIFNSVWYILLLPQIEGEVSSGIETVFVVFIGR